MWYNGRMLKILQTSKLNSLHVLKEAKTDRQLITNDSKIWSSFFGHNLEHVDTTEQFVERLIKGDNEGRFLTTFCQGMEKCQQMN